MTSSRNRLGNVSNPFQGNIKKVLCVCSAGLLRSPTCAVVLSQEPYNYNTRAVGITTEFALIPVDDALLLWADEIVCMEDYQEKRLKEMLNEYNGCLKPIFNLQIEDDYRYRDSELVQEIKFKYNKFLPQS